MLTWHLGRFHEVVGDRFVVAPLSEKVPTVHGKAHQLLHPNDNAPRRAARSTIKTMTRANIDTLIRDLVQYYWGDDVGDAPKQPGVYAWYIPFFASNYESVGKCFASIEERLSQFAALTELSGRVGNTQVTFRQSNSGEDWESRIPGDGDLQMTSTAIEAFANQITPLSILAAPIYIGKATGKNGLRGRLQSHISGKLRVQNGDPYLGSFAARVEHILNEPSQLKQCIVACMPFSNVSNADRLIGEIEHFLIRSVTPSQSKRG